MKHILIQRSRSRERDFKRALLIEDLRADTVGRCNQRMRVAGGTHT